MKKRLWIWLAPTLTVVLVATAFLLWPEPEFEWTSPAKKNYSRTLVVAADKDYPPYSFTDDESGNPAGHDVELIYALGDVMEANIDLRLVSWSEALTGLQSGEYDLALGATHSTGRRGEMIFSLPVTSDPYVAFGREGEEFVFGTLMNKTVCTIFGESAVDDFIIPYGLDGRANYYDTYTECFESVARGESDYVIAPYLTGIKIADSEGFSGIEATGPELFKSIFCVCAINGNQALIDSVNDALAAITESGMLEEINERWLVKYVQVSSPDLFIKNNKETLVMGALALVVVFFAIYFFAERRNIQRLYIETERARIFEETLQDTLFEYKLREDRMEYSYKDANKNTRRNKINHYIFGRRYERTVHPDDRQKYRELLLGNGFENETATIECRVNFGAAGDTQEWEWYRVSMHTVLSMTGAIVSVLGRMENVTVSVSERNEALRLAATDQLTGLNNRAAFIHAVGRRLSAGDGAYALLMLDIDDFKVINDTYGHAAGDRALISTGELLQRVFGADDIIGRFGGDEFLVFLECGERDVVSKRAEQLKRLLRSDSSVPGGISCSLGAVFETNRAQPVEMLIGRADTALYTVKQSGKDGYAFA